MELLWESRASPMAQQVRSPPAMQETQETQVQSLGSCPPPLQEGMATHSSVLARKIPWTEEPGDGGGLQSKGSQRGQHDWATKHSVVRITGVNSLEQQSPVFLASGTGFVEDSFSMDWCRVVVRDGFRMIQAHVFIVRFISNLMPLLTWQVIPVHNFWGRGPLL